MAKFIIEIRSKGFETAKRDFEKAQKGAESYRKENDKLRGSTSGLRKTIGRLRNTLLLASFAFVGAAKSISGFVRASSGFQDVQTRLVGLTGSTEAAKEAFETFNNIAATTPFALQDVVQAGAQLEAFGVDSQRTLRSVTDLAAFMGTNATEAASALGRAFAGGAGAADILRERGILQLIKDSQGIKDLSKLTLPEFRKALLSALVDPVAGIRGSSKRLSKTFTGAVSNMQDSITRFQAMVGDLMLPALTSMAQNTEKFFRAIDLEKLARFATSIGVAATALLVYRARAIGAALATAALTLNVKAVAAVLGTLGAMLAVDKLLQTTNAFGNLNTATQQTTSSTSVATIGMRQFTQQLGKTNIAIEDNTNLLRAQHELNTATALLHFENQGMDEKRLKKIKLLLNAEKILIDALKDKANVDRQAMFTSGELIVQTDHLTEAEKKLVENVKRYVHENKIRINVDKEAVDVSNDLSTSFNTLEGAVNGFKNANGDSTQALKIFIKTAAQLIALTGPQGQAASSILSFGSAFIGHTGGLIKNNGIQRFAQGGMVQGQDNVPIMAQAGEFIMRREAVQNIGVGNLAQMNRSASGGGVTVNIQGNMVGNESFVRDTLIPEIARATNQNLA